MYACTADYGYDPLGLGKDPEKLEKYRAAELIHARWAMLGAVGCFTPEAIANAGEKIKGATWWKAPFVLASGEKLNWFTQVSLFFVHLYHALISHFWRRYSSASLL